MKNISQEELNKILKKHKMWLNDEEGGERADLRYTNLSDADLSKTDLTYADLTGADLTDANLSNADLSKGNLTYANLSNADLSNTDFKYANLTYAILSDANLINTDLIGANLWCANLIGANLKNIKTSMSTIGYNLACPEEGVFTGYKKANGCIIKLLILEDTKRSSATTSKCRCDKAKVLEIKDINTGELMNEITSTYDHNFVYKVGEIVSVDDFDENRWNECSTGIHFFMNKENALNY